MAWSGDRKPGKDGRIPPVGNTVDTTKAKYANTIGIAELVGAWTDAEFDPSEPALHYARAHLVRAEVTRTILREPLLRFLLIGFGVFVLYDVLRGGDTGAPRDIVVTDSCRFTSAQRSAATRRVARPSRCWRNCRPVAGRRHSPRPATRRCCPPGMQSASPQVIANTFGSEFAAQVEEAPVSRWTGPLQSGFGLHLVRVDDRKAGAMPAFEQIRRIVLREWQSEQRT